MGSIREQWRVSPPVVEYNTPSREKVRTMLGVIVWFFCEESSSDVYGS